MKLLVTGGAGFIGSNFIRMLLGEEPELKLLVNLDKLTYAGRRENMVSFSGDRRYSFIYGDVSDASLLKDLFNRCDFDCVVHFAAESNVDFSITGPREFLHTNIDGTFALLETLKYFPETCLVYVGTDEEYGEAKESLSRNGDEYLPKSPYAASKAAASLLCHAYLETYHLKIYRTRCTNNFGAYQDISKLIPRFISRALQDQELPVYGNGHNVRDWIDVKDHCRYLAELVFGKQPPGQYNISARQERSVLEIANNILALLDKLMHLIKFVKDRPGHVERHAMECTPLKTRNGLVWAPRTNFEDSLSATVSWYQNNTQWWKGAGAK